jgi:PTS system galactitol-specific IIA component
MSQNRTQWFYEDFVVMGMKAESAIDAISQLGTLLNRRGFVKESFIPAVIEREEELATGLPTAEVGVAIPHTDPEHVLQSAIGVAILENPVEFGEMGNPGSTVWVDVVCLLAIAKAEDVVKVLQSLVRIFQTPRLLKEIVRAGDALRVISILRQHYQIE